MSQIVNDAVKALRERPGDFEKDTAESRYGFESLEYLRDVKTGAKYKADGSMILSPAILRFGAWASRKLRKAIDEWHENNILYRLHHPEKEEQDV